MIKIFILLTTILILSGCSRRESVEDTKQVSAPAPTQAQPIVVNVIYNPPDPAPETTPVPEPAEAAAPVPTREAVKETTNSAPAIGRTWVSTDGRKVDAELISRTVDTVTIRRNADQRHFTIPLTSLSEADRKYVAVSNVPVQQIKQFNVERLNQLKKTIPAISAHSPLESSFPSLTDLFNKYRRNIESISQTGYARSLDMIRMDIEADLKRLEPIAATNLSNPPTYYQNHGWSKGSGAWREVWAARSSVNWLKGPLNQHLTELEKLK
jgi:hypothetical protein